MEPTEVSHDAALERVSACVDYHNHASAPKYLYFLYFSVSQWRSLRLPPLDEHKHQLTATTPTAITTTVITINVRLPLSESLSGSISPDIVPC